MKTFQLSATAFRGLGPVLAREVGRGTLHGNDGRNDVVTFDGDAETRLSDIRTAEDVFAVITTVEKWHDVRDLVRKLLDPHRITNAINSRNIVVGRPLKSRNTYRVIARVTDEEWFKRTDLRRGAEEHIGRTFPNWRWNDPSEVEIWISQIGPRRFVSSLRITDASNRQRGGRVEERAGALRPTVAAAMVSLAGKPGYLPLLDPFCGSGTIGGEASGVGWKTFSSDIEFDAVDITRDNIGGGRVFTADAFDLPFSDKSIGPIITNLPWGEQFEMQGEPEEFLGDVLREFRRVQTANSPIVLLVPSSPELKRAIGNRGLVVKKRLNIELLGQRTAVWHLMKG